MQTLTLQQAEFIATAGTVDEDADRDRQINSQIALLEQVAQREGLTIYEFGRLGAEKMAERTAAFSGNAVTAAHILPLLTEPEFRNPGIA